MLFHRANWDDDGVIFLQERFQFGVGEFPQKYGGRLHAGGGYILPIFFAIIASCFSYCLLSTVNLLRM